MAENSGPGKLSGSETEGKKWDQVSESLLGSDGNINWGSGLSLGAGYKGKHTGEAGQGDWKRQDKEISRLQRER